MPIPKKKPSLINLLTIPVTYILLMWIAHAINEFSFHAFDTFGIFPRALDGLKGIFFAPFLHGDWGHLISNTMPLLLLLPMLFIFYSRVALPAFIFIYIFTGFLVWTFARPNYHIGASGIVYGVIAFIFWSGVFRRNLRSIILTLVIIILYSGYIVGAFPSTPGVSWESHLLGGIAGIIVAFMFKNILEIDEKRDENSKQDEILRMHYFAADTFEMTREERKRKESDENWLDWFSSRSQDF